MQGKSAIFITVGFYLIDPSSGDSGLLV